MTLKQLVSPILFTMELTGEYSKKFHSYDNHEQLAINLILEELKELAIEKSIIIKLKESDKYHNFYKEYMDLLIVSVRYLVLHPAVTKSSSFWDKPVNNNDSLISRKNTLLESENVLKLDLEDVLNLVDELSFYPTFEDYKILEAVCRSNRSKIMNKYNANQYLKNNEECNSIEPVAGGYIGLRKDGKYLKGNNYKKYTEFL